MSKLITGILLLFSLGFLTAKYLESYYTVNQSIAGKKDFLEKEYFDAKPASPYTKCVYLKLFGVCNTFWHQDEYERLTSQ